MSTRVMKLILNKKFEAWQKSIEDENLRNLVAKNTIITGGCIASMLLKEEINDFDLYFKNFETCKAVADYYVHKFISMHDNCTKIPIVKADELDNDGKKRVRIHIQSAGIAGDKTQDNTYQYFEGDISNGNVDPSLMAAGEEYVEASISPNEVLDRADEINAGSVGTHHGADTEKGKFKPVFLSDNAITLSDKVQLVLRFYGVAEEIHRNYDFVHCTNYWDSETKELVLHPKALESLLLKQLYYVGSKYPVCSFIRTRKFIKRGFYINAGELLKICFQISKLNLEDVKVLEDQLTGVDQAYFQQLINYMYEEKAKNPNWIMDLPYLVSIVDKLF